MTTELNMNRIVKDFLRRDEMEFFGWVLLQIPRFFSEVEPTAAIRFHEMQLRLVANPYFMGSLEKWEQEKIIHHEVLHVSFRHPFKFFAMKIDRTNEEEYRRWGIAADLAVNSHINGIKDMVNTMLWTPDILDLKWGKSLEWYYNALSNFDPMKLQFPDIPDALLKLLIQAMDNHNWGDGLFGLKQQQDQIILDAGKKMRGEFPAGIEEIIKEIKDALIPWSVMLRRIINSLNPTTTQTMRRKSRRFPIPPGRKYIYSGKILVGIDTSVSVSDKQLQQFLAEVKAMADTGHEIWVAECDAAIHTCYKLKTKPNVNIHGRGGTDFQPVFDKAEEIKPDVLIYLTDGDAPDPVARTNAKVVWVYTKDHSRKHAPPGAYHLIIPEDI